jgi:aspartyl/glutamyl-tRNA(Asn/Gln) amidotransferase C subunit
MLSEKDIDALLALSRMEIAQEEKDALRTDVGAILEYVGQVEKVASEVPGETYPLKNVMRPDEHPHIAGEYTEALLATAPDNQDGFVKVKKIL